MVIRTLSISSQVSALYNSNYIKNTTNNIILGSVANFGPIGSHSEGFEDYVKFDLSSAMKS